VKKDYEKCKSLTFGICMLQFAIFFSGCAYQAGSRIQPGRYALFRGDAKAALAHFQRAAEIDPDSAMRVGPMKEGVWTYVGRAHYASGDYKAAAKALEQARSRHPDDYMAPLYLGLSLSRQGDRSRGAKEIQTGLTGLGDWLDYINRYDLDGSYWDPGGYIRSEIKDSLDTIQGKEINWPQLIASVEKVGIDFEREPDEVLRQKRRDRRDSSKGDDRGR